MLSSADKFKILIIAALLVTMLTAGANPVLAQQQKEGDASLRLEYQYIEPGKFYDDVASYDYWSTKTHVLMLSASYAVSDRVSVYAALPYIRKKFIGSDYFGGDPHDPNAPYWIDFVPPDKRFWDDGEYHGDFQDLSFGVQYLALDGPLTVAPYIGFGFPTTDYPFYAKAAIGKNLWQLPVGVTLGYIPSFSDWFLDGNLTYVFSEKPLDVNVNYMTFRLSAGYWFKPQFSMNIFVTGKYGINGFVMPWDFTDDPFYGNYPDDFDTKEWWMHDRLLRNRHVDVGLEASYFFNERFMLSGTWYTGVWADQGFETDLGLTLALTRYFSGD